MAMELHQFVLVHAGKFAIDADLSEEDKMAALAAKRAEILGVTEAPLLLVETVELDMALYQIDEERFIK
jgi:hypothetical protein